MHLRELIGACYSLPSNNVKRENILMRLAACEISGSLDSPEHARLRRLAGQRAMLEHMRQASAVGGPEKVRADIARFVERTGADEIIVSSAIYDPAKRRRSLEITVRALA